MDIVIDPPRCVWVNTRLTYTNTRGLVIRNAGGSCFSSRSFFLEDCQSRKSIMSTSFPPFDIEWKVKMAKQTSISFYLLTESEKYRLITKFVKIIDTIQFIRWRCHCHEMKSKTRRRRLLIETASNNKSFPVIPPLFWSSWGSHPAIRFEKKNEEMISW